jgi:hypothetical protein
MEGMTLQRRREALAHLSATVAAAAVEELRRILHKIQALVRLRLAVSKPEAGGLSRSEMRRDLQSGF